MARPLPTHPKHPERICWGCDKLCSKNALACGNGSERTPHPVELFGEDWLEWELVACADENSPRADELVVPVKA